MALLHPPDTLRPRLLTEAAHGGLKPSPTERLRRVLLHLSYSMALSHLLDTIPPALCVQPTRRFGAVRSAVGQRPQRRRLARSAGAGSRPLPGHGKAALF